MHLVRFDLVNFRNYERLSALFFSKYNILMGANAQGKTNLLEAIFTLCLSKSFRASSDGELIRFGANGFQLFGEFRSDLGTSHELAIAYQAGKGKEIHFDKKKKGRSSELIGQFPVVLFSPSHFSITLGGPADRRRFVDTLLAQSSDRYLQGWQKYLRIVKQRNKILSRARAGHPVSATILEPWNVSLVEWGTQVVAARSAFVVKFSELLSDKYSRLTHSGDELKLVYKPFYLDGDLEDPQEAFSRALERYVEKERARGMSLIGPHRDDFIFYLNGVELRKFGSRGEHKSALMACKLAEFDFLRAERQETPILLLDDLFSELDADRRSSIWETVQNLGQVFVTATEKAFFSGLDNARVYRIERGQVFADATV